MPEPAAHDRLEVVLSSIGDHLITDETVPLAEPTTSTRPWWHRVAATAAAVLVVAGVSLVVPPVRSAVAGWVGIGSTGVESVPDPAADPTGLLPITEGLEEITVTEAEKILDRPLPSTSSTALGEPGRLAAMPEGGVILVWSSGASSLWIHSSEARTEARYSKLLGDSDQVEAVEDLGEAALLITGDHVLRTPNRRIAAGSVLLWTADGLDFRLESDSDPGTMVATARGIT